MNDTYQQLNLQEWLLIGEQTGRITTPQVATLAYSMDEREAVVWVADIVLGRITETEALTFMERAIQYHHRYCPLA